MTKLTKNGFDRMSVDALLDAARIILNAMAGHAAFASPTPTLQSVQFAVDELAAAALDASGGDRYKIALRKQKQATVIALLRRLGLYVDVVADGDEAIAVASKFPLARRWQPVPPITYVAQPVIGPGANVGELTVKVKAVAGATYLFYYSTDAEAPIAEWKAVPCTSSRCVLKGLQSATRYYIRIAAIGRRSQVVYSNASTYVTQ